MLIRARLVSRAIGALATLIALAACAVGCAARPTADPGRIGVVAAFYPLQFLVERIGGDRVHVTNLVKPGAEPHDLELSPRQMAQVADARLVVYLRGFQPAVDEAVDLEASDRAVDGLAAVATRQTTEEVGNDPTTPRGTGAAVVDPHVWLDPARYARIADAVAARLVAIDPPNAERYRRQLAHLRRDLDALDGEYRTGLAHCARRDIVTSHAAFGYLADRYHLSQVAITGLTPEQEPSPQRLAEVARVARSTGTTTVFFETLVSPKVAEALAGEVGARAEVLNPIEGLPPGSTGNYLSVMRDNLRALRQALGCS
ncbi:MAG TPA: metal ABC transporter substrate-binding protein [Micromonosporaceae bacterium]